MQVCHFHTRLQFMRKHFINLQIKSSMFIFLREKIPFNKCGPLLFYTFYVERLTVFFSKSYWCLGFLVCWFFLIMGKEETKIILQIRGIFIVGIINTSPKAHSHRFVVWWYWRKPSSMMLGREEKICSWSCSQCLSAVWSPKGHLFCFWWCLVSSTMCVSSDV